jgi:hypothetical protein
MRRLIMFRYVFVFLSILLFFAPLAAALAQNVKANKVPKARVAKVSSPQFAHTKWVCKPYTYNYDRTLKLGRLDEEPPPVLTINQSFDFLEGGIVKREVKEFCEDCFLAEKIYQTEGQWKPSGKTILLKFKELKGIVKPSGKNIVINFDQLSHNVKTVQCGRK